jgi:hypothetical protein
VNVAKDGLDELLTTLIEAFAVEDIWLLEAGSARECGLTKPVNLIVIVPDGSEAHVVERAAIELIRARPQWNETDLFVFPLSGLSRTPRPLLLKMALTSGENIYSK